MPKSWTNPTEAPWRLHDRGLYMGTNLQTKKEVYLPLKWLPTHCWVQGPPGVGKSALLLWLFGLLCRVPKASVILVNPKGALGRAARDYAFVNGFGHRVAMLDPADEDRIMGYSPARQNALAVATHAKAIREGIRSGCGQDSFDQTQQLARVLFLALYAVRELNLTLVEAVGLLRPESELRAAVLPRIRDPYVREAFQYIDRQRPARQDELLASSLARLESLVLDPMIRRILTQQDHSLDLGEIMENRGILIANLELYKPLRQDDVRLLGRMLLNDILAHAFARPEAKRTPVFLIIDEVHTVASADLCDALALGRELGLHCIMAHQHEAQLREESVVPGLADALLSCARTKIVFGGNAVRHLESTIKELFADQVDLIRVKDELTGLELDPIETTRTTLSESSTRGRSWGTTRGSSRGRSFATSRGVARGTSDGTSRAYAHGRSRSTTEGESEGESHTDARGRSEGTSHQVGTSESRGTADTTGVAVTNGQSKGTHTGGGVGQTILPNGDIIVTEQDTSGATFGEFSAVTTMGSHTDSASTGRHESHGTQSTHSESEADTTHTSRSWSRSRGTHDTTTRGRTHARHTTRSDTSTTGTQETISRGTNRGGSASRTHGRSVGPFYTYKKRRVVTNRTFMSTDEQLFEKLQAVQRLPQAHYVLKAGNNPALFVRAPYVESPRVSVRRLAEGLSRVYEKPYYSSPAEIDVEERERTRRLLSDVVDDDE